MKIPMYKEEPKKRHPLENIKYVVAVAAGKGGVGKSAVAVNLALALRQLGYSVGLCDGDVYGPSLRKMLPEEQPPQQNGNAIAPAICFGGIRMISMAYFRREGEAAVIRAPIANGIISQFIQNVAWGQLDFLLIDFPPGTGDIQLTLAQQANLSAAVIVTTPQEVALLDVRKAMHMFRQVNVPIAGVVENMSYFLHAASGEKIALFGTGGGKKLAQENQVPLLGEIPLDPEICRTADAGQPLIHDNNRDSPVVQEFMSAARKLCDQLKQGVNKEELQQVDLAWKEM